MHPESGTSTSQLADGWALTRGDTCTNSLFRILGQSDSLISLPHKSKAASRPTKMAQTSNEGPCYDKRCYCVFSHPHPLYCHRLVFRHFKRFELSSFPNFQAFRTVAKDKCDLCIELQTISIPIFHAFAICPTCFKFDKSPH